MPAENDPTKETPPGTPAETGDGDNNDASFISDQGEAGDEGTSSAEGSQPEGAAQDANGEDGSGDASEVAASVRAMAQASPHLENVVAFLDDAKIGDKDLQAIFGEALANNDIGKIDQALLEKRMGKAKAALVNTAIQAYVAEATAAVAARDKIVTDVMGSPEAFKTAVEWANDDKNMSPEDRTALDSMIKEGGLSAKLAAQHLKAAYEASPGTNVEHGNPLGGDRTAQSDMGPMTRQEWNEAMDKVNPRDTKTIAALRARRLAGQRAGI